MLNYIIYKTNKTWKSLKSVKNTNCYKIHYSTTNVHLHFYKLFVAWLLEVKELLQYGNFLSIMHWHSYFCFKTITVVVIYEYCNILLQGERWRLNSNNEQCSKWTLISKIIYKNCDPTKFIDHHCMVFDLKILIVW